MSLLATLEHDYEEVKTAVERFATQKLSPALSDATGLLNHPVVRSLLAAVHVPAGALDMAVKVIDGLEDLYRPDAAAEAPAVTPVAADVPAAPVETAAEAVSDTPIGDASQAAIVQPVVMGADS